MQETRDKDGFPHQELFEAETQEALNKEMELRLKQLQQKGHQLVRRVPVTARQAKTFNKRKGKSRYTRKGKAKR